MTAVLGGNVRAEIVSSAGIRLQRISLRQATTDLLLPRQPEAPRKPPMLEAAAAFAAIRAGRPVGFNPSCVRRGRAEVPYGFMIRPDARHSG